MSDCEELPVECIGIGYNATYKFASIHILISLYTTKVTFQVIFAGKHLEALGDGEVNNPFISTLRSS